MQGGGEGLQLSETNQPNIMVLLLLLLLIVFENVMEFKESNGLNFFCFLLLKGVQNIPTFHPWVFSSALFMQILKSAELYF